MKDFRVYDGVKHFSIWAKVPVDNVIYNELLSKAELDSVLCRQYWSRVEYEFRIGAPFESWGETHKTDVYQSQIKPNIDIIYDIYQHNYKERNEN